MLFPNYKRLLATATVALLATGNVIAITTPALAINTGNGDLQLSCFRQRGYWTFTPNQDIKLFIIEFKIRGQDTGEEENFVRVYPGTTQTVGGETQRTFPGDDSYLEINGVTLTNKGFASTITVRGRCKG